MVIKHIAGEYSDKIQRCIICGYLITDYNGVVWIGDEPRGFAEGQEVFVNENKSGRFMTIVEPDKFRNCNDN